MALTVTSRPEPFCLKNCHFMDLEAHTTTLYSGSEIFDLSTELHCTHEAICKMWAEAMKGEPNGTGKA